MLKKLTILIVAAAAGAGASGLPEAYKPPPEPYEPPAEEPRVEKPEREGPGAELHDVRFLFGVGGVAEADLPSAVAKLLITLERRAAYLAKRNVVERGPGEAKITVELYGCPDPGRALEILTAPGLLELQAVAERDTFAERAGAAGWPAAKLLPYEHGNIILLAADDRDGFREAVKPTLAAAERLLWTRQLESEEHGAVYKAAFATGDGMAVTDVIDAVVVAGVGGNPEVHFDLGDRDATIFSGLTGRHLGKALAVVFDDELFYTARVREQTFKSGRIVGELDEDRAADIALLLSSGSLPATLTLLEYSVDGESRPIPPSTK
jgi:preprotein translocase subunit SecD